MHSTHNLCAINIPRLTIRNNTEKSWERGWGSGVGCYRFGYTQEERGNSKICSACVDARKATRSNSSFLVSEGES
jgi:hypothetical protein